MSDGPTILTVMDSLKPWFGGECWVAWRAALASIFALPLSLEQLAIYRKHTGRETPPTAPVAEFWAVVGRRGGKSVIAALLALFFSVFKSYQGVLRPGEHGVVMILASDRRQARVVFNYLTAFFRLPSLAKLIDRQLADAIHLKNGITVEIHTASFKAVRGYTCVAIICDEISFWPSDTSANPDVEILTALRPSMSTVPGALLIAISSPYARRGELWRAYQGHYGKDGDPILVWQANSRSMNPTIDQTVIDAAYEQDEAAASAEFGAQFRRDVESFIARESVDACVVGGRNELPYVADTDYHAFVDPSGGSNDAMTLAIAHRRDDEAVILDAVREVKPPFSPANVVTEFTDLLRKYRLHTVTGDRYGGEWPREAFRKHGVQYHVADRSKSDLYRDALPLLNSRRVELLDHRRLIAQLCGLERRTARGGKDSIDHGPAGHDDVINAAAGALVRAAGRRPALVFSGGAPVDEVDEQAAYAQRVADSAQEIAEAVGKQSFWWPR